MKEFDIIARFFAPLAHDNAALGLADDAAILSVPEGHELVVTTDGVVEGVHFIGDEPPMQLAQKLLRVNLSDLAAMGATPYGYTLALMLPASTDEQWITPFAEGLKADQKEFSLTLLGGDTTHTPGPLALSATLFGFVPKGAALKRSGAKAGEHIYVTGTIGDGALGLKAAQKKLTSQAFLKRYQLPEPRVAVGQKLRGVASACMDISDGLMQDLGHICASSHVGAEVHFKSVPLSQHAQVELARDTLTRELILGGGDDYELLFTAPASAHERLQKIAHETKTPITLIGRVTGGKHVVALDEASAEIALTHTGYQHFA